MKPFIPHTQTKQSLVSQGYCQRCHTLHSLPTGNSHALAIELINRLEKEQTVDLFRSDPLADPKLSTSPLFGNSRGKMFGILECRNNKGEQEILYGFSGQFNGVWEIEGWVPPLLDKEIFLSVTSETEKKIKRLTKEIESLPRGCSGQKQLRDRRKNLSKNLMKEIHSLYTLTNFKGETASLQKAFYGKHGIPTGTGDCCAPKLLQYAALNGLTPVGLCEFFFGRKTRSGSHAHGQFSLPCTEKCVPILGFMLCGLEQIS